MGGVGRPARQGPHWIERWQPENPAFWAEKGRTVARRNMVASIFVEHLGFSTWSLWPVLVLFMVPAAGFTITPDQKFLLVTLVTIVGAVLRIPYTFAVGRFGGRNWTVVSAALLLVPTICAAAAIRLPGLPLWVFLLAAAVGGIGGGNFASSMANINFFYRDCDKGRALGLNAGGGNLGVALTQLVGLAVIALATIHHPEYVPLIYLPLIVAATLCAMRYMDNLSCARTDIAAQVTVVKDRHCWLMSVLYVGTFGSFIGYSFAFGLVLQNQFHRTPLEAAYLTFIGPLAGSLSRPVGGWLADKLGGARVTLWTFGAMAAGTAVILVAALRGSFALFVAGFVAVFVLSGFGNGSTYKLIPGIFQRRAHAGRAAAQDPEVALAQARRLSAAMLGIVGAVGALGGAAVNLAFRESYLAAGSAAPALIGFLAFYALCAGVTYLGYLRRPAADAVPLPDLALSGG